MSADKVFPNCTAPLAADRLRYADKAELNLTLIVPSHVCGKSTLLKLVVANLIEPSDGRILWWSGGFEVGTADRSLAFRFRIRPDAWARVRTNVRCARSPRGLPSAEPRTIAEALRARGLEGFARCLSAPASAAMKDAGVDRAQPRTAHPICG